MDNVSRALRAHYEETFRRYGPTSKGVDWGEDTNRQALRYQKMLNLIKPGQKDGTSLLDVGCGYGGLLEYANQNNVRLQYTGIDIAENMVRWAQEAFPRATLMVGDVLEIGLPNRYAYVVCNGILTQKLNVPGIEMDAFAGKLIRRMFDLCEVGTAFNVMTTKVNFYSNNLYYRNPAELLSWCLSEISPHVRLDHAYPLYEYTIYLYRHPVN
jgi:SAM-dependent methyltransferase